MAWARRDCFAGSALVSLFVFTSVQILMLASICSMISSKKAGT